MYYIKCFSLDILPLEYHLMFTEICLFYQIINNLVPISLPHYIINSPSRTRAQKSDDLLYTSTIIPRISSYGHNNPTGCKKENPVSEMNSTGIKRKRKRNNQSDDTARIGGLNAFQKNL